ncbi:MAG: hypothetical protein ACLP50_09755 [Solirubrobacteraceae bacterium]
MSDRHIVIAHVPDAVAFEEEFQFLPCTVAADCDRCDATTTDTIEFLCLNPDPDRARAEFEEACDRLGVHAQQIAVRAA